MNQPRPMEAVPDPDTIQATITEIQTVTGEPKVSLLYRIVQHFGPDQALAFLEQTKHIEAQGGLMVPDGSRPRTMAGVYLHLVKESLREAGWTSTAIYQKFLATARSKTTLYPVIVKDTRERALRLLASKQRGVISNMRVSLTGRPSTLETSHPSYVVATMRGPQKLPSLPKGLPPLPSSVEVTYVVYIAKKQWMRVEESLQNSPDDELMIEGLLVPDPGLKRSVIYAHSITTKALRRAQTHRTRPTGTA